MTNDNAKLNESGADSEVIAPLDRLVLWLFVFFFILFGGFIVGELIVGLLFRA